MNSWLGGPAGSSGLNASVPDLSQFYCVCTPGFTDPFCNETVEINPCDSLPCQYGGTCIMNLDNGFVCECPVGTTGDFCETDINECFPNPCFNGGTCFESGSSGLNASVPDLSQFYCVCPPGFTDPFCNET